jgi:hypothetical protein
MLNERSSEGERNVSDSLTSSSLYREFQAEREEVLKYKWIESEKAGYDIGYEAALTGWVVKHRSEWRKARKMGQGYSPEHGSQVPIELAPRLKRINEELYSYLSRNPHLMYELSPRKFEELIADILKNMGCEIELTPQTRDGGRDVLAVIRTPVSKMLIIVECKKYRPDRKVGLDIVERFFHVIDRKDNASCGLIATTSFFSPDAQALARRFEYRLALRDFDCIKEWIAQYGKWKKDAGNLIWTPTYVRTPTADLPQ